MSEHDHTDQGQPGREQGYSDPTQPAPQPATPADQGQPGTDQGYSPETVRVQPPTATEKVQTTPADLPNRTQRAASDADAAGYNAEPSEMYDPVAAHAGDGFPDAAPSGAQGTALEGDR